VSTQLPLDSTPVEPATQHRIEQFLYREAELLDNFEMRAWLELLDEGMVLTVPIRSDHGPGSSRPDFSPETCYIRDSYEMIAERVEKISKEYAWSENPRSRVRHHIGNIRITEMDDGEYGVWNNQFVYRSQGDTPDHALLSAQRQTRLGETEEQFEILDRTVYLDHSILPSKNLTLPLL
jgi:3-phenylpropionate/cinnamic acid dioxygenase small subunit